MKKTRKLKELTEILSALNDYSKKQHFIVSVLDEANERQDEKLMAKICLYIIGEDSPNHIYSPDLQISCLHWLTEDCIERLNSCKTDKTREKVWQELFHCLWAYKWFVQDLPLMPEFAKEKIEFYNELMKDYYQRGDMSMAAVDKTLMLQAMNMGDIDNAKHYYQRWSETEGDEFSDCEACELHDKVHYHHFIGQYKKAAQLAQPILTGELSCGEVPHNTYYYAIDSLIESDDWAQAQQYLPQALELIESSGEEFIALIPQFIQLHIKLGQYDKAEALAHKYHDSIGNISQNHPIVSLHYLMAMARFDEVAVELAQQLAELYDKRNANHYYSKRLKHILSSHHQTLQ